MPTPPALPHALTPLAAGKTPPGGSSGKRLIYPDVQDCRALVIDGNPTSRSILTDMLRQMGVGNVVQTGKILDARKSLETRVFDIVLCDYHFDNSPISGQDLLDELRRAQLLPYSTVFVMVTGEASYAKVAEAAEAALDSYLLKPHTAATLEQRLLQARHRKKILGPIFEAIEQNDFVTAARLCQTRFTQRGEYWMYAARIGAELYIRAGQHQAAKALYEAVQATKALPWAKLGIARTEFEEGQLPQAKRTLETLISEQPSYADAYDVMGRVQVEQGDLDGALATYRSAINVTPNSIARLQKQGMLAFFMGEADEAIEALERCVRNGISSKMFDCQSLMLLAMLHFDKRDTKGFQRSYDNMALALERAPNSTRLQRFLGVANVFKALNERRVGDCVDMVRLLVDDIRSESFDFEAATNMLAMLARLRNTEIQLADDEAWITTLAERFCVSKAATDMLCQAVNGNASYAEIIHNGQLGVSSMAEKAMTHSMTGAPDVAVKALLERGKETLNAKLIELAGLVLTRHAAKIPDGRELGLVINELKLKYCTKGTQVNLGRNTGRAAGGLNLRTKDSAAAGTENLQ
jgi:CheY-like chemotaxis protein